jgi:predicted porin
MKHQRIALIIVAATCAAIQMPSARAIDVTAGDWKLSFAGNVNADYIYQSCQGTSNAVVVAGGLACVASGSSSSVSNGLLPAALTINGSTTQKGWDLGFTFGLYPGISTNDGGSPNLQTGNGPTHTALGTSSIDLRQAFLTFGNASFGTVMAGRNIGLFAADAILNDMTLIGVGAGNGSYAAPSNTSLGSIGLGYIYTDWLAQINYTTPDLGGLKVTFGIFDPLNVLGQPVPSNKDTPGFHAKAAWKLGGGLYLSASGLYQKQRNAAAVGVGNYDSWAFDVGGKWDIGMTGLQAAGWYYYGDGVGTTGLFVLSNDPLGNPRHSQGFLAQLTWTIAQTKLGVNYGESKLDQATGELNPTLVSKNSKATAGVYQTITDNLTLLAEYTHTMSENQVGGKNSANTFNVGAFLKF